MARLSSYTCRSMFSCKFIFTTNYPCWIKHTSPQFDKRDQTNIWQSFRDFYPLVGTPYLECYCERMVRRQCRKGICVSDPILLYFQVRYMEREWRSVVPSLTYVLVAHQSWPDALVYSVKISFKSTWSNFAIILSPNVAIVLAIILLLL